jgi:hypothetical protein
MNADVEKTADDEADQGGNNERGQLCEKRGRSAAETDATRGKL